MNIKQFFAEYLPKKSKLGYIAFCDGTSCHGFLELYHSRSKLATCFWIVTISLSFAITTYQTYEAVRQYLDQPTSTSITIADEDGILYPPFSVCYSHWYHWVDWYKVESLKCSRQSIMFALSYAYNIYSDNLFNVSEAEEEFLEIMKINNLTSIKDFYSIIAIYPNMFEKVEQINGSDFDIRIRSYQSKKGLDVPINLFCYEAKQSAFSTWTSSGYMFEYSNGKPKTFPISISYAPYEEYQSPMTMEEYKASVKNWLEMDGQFYDSNETDYIWPVFFYPNAYEMFRISLSPEIESIYISFKSSVFSRYNKGSCPCRDYGPQLATNISCKQQCVDSFDKAACTCQSLEKAINAKNDFPNATCKKAIAFSPYTHYLGDPDLCEFGYMRSSDDTINVSSCIADCLTPCTIWKWDYSTIITPRTHPDYYIVTNIIIEYPFADHIVIFNEGSIQTFQNFVGNIGGLVGIWTGASLISFIQFFYLCFCTGTDDRVIQVKKVVKK